MICPVPPPTSTTVASFPKDSHGYDLGTDSAAKTPIPFIAKTNRSLLSGSADVNMSSNDPLSDFRAILKAVLFTAWDCANPGRVNASYKLKLISNCLKLLLGETSEDDTEKQRSDEVANPFDIVCRGR